MRGNIYIYTSAQGDVLSSLCPGYYGKPSRCITIAQQQHLLPLCRVTFFTRADRLMGGLMHIDRKTKIIELYSSTLDRHYYSDGLTSSPPLWIIRGIIFDSNWFYWLQFKAGKRGFIASSKFIFFPFFLVTNIKYGRRSSTACWWEKSMIESLLAPINSTCAHKWALASHIKE